ncbi:putative cell division protein FtsL [Selenomonas ruminantium subsp. lactilytica TAM6421]|uniref:Putative cell division protein FtsL n=1 Tax=Selenomonas ruminantium subsp. lactilytica (strain NBRC 103574 / TAM6421) TaxID=927704 RepID=I0GSZ7_SELRL|nr:septum formation initiator family protein [Selenomonas ruminantium]BAL83884.1 putative cell division protein FtsL [Selenomonas ruminantium subsp. lactilytica TAM6421]
MKARRERRGINWFALIMLAIIVYFSSILISQQVYLSQAADDYAAAKARLEAAQKENEALKEETRQLNELGYIEKIAREELGMTRAGELPYSTGHK